MAAQTQFFHNKKEKRIMHGRFADLKPDTEEGVDLWKQYEEEFRTLLREVNMDVFEGDGEIYSGIVLRGDYTQHKDFKDPRPPGVCLSVHRIGVIIISPMSDHFVQVTFESWKHPYSVSWKGATPGLQGSMENSLVIAVKFLLG